MEVSSTPPQTIREHVPDPACVEIMQEKKQVALLNWASHNIDPNLLEAARKNFAIRAWLFQEIAECDYKTAIENVPFVIPQTVRARTSPTINLFRLLREYRAALETAEEVTRKKWHSTSNKRLRLRELFPGVPSSRIQKYAEMEKASEVARDYVAWKYNLEVSGASVKKYLGQHCAQLKAVLELVKQANERRSRGEDVVPWLAENISQAPLFRLPPS